MKSPRNEEQQKFWETFRAGAEENRVRPDRSSFYVKWAQAFASFLPEKRLQNQSGKDIQASLADLAQRQGVADWQVRQANQALNALVFFYNNVLRELIVEMNEFARAKRPRRLPEVLTRAEVGCHTLRSFVCHASA